MTCISEKVWSTGSRQAVGILAVWEAVLAEKDKSSNLGIGPKDNGSGSKDWPLDIIGLKNIGLAFRRAATILNVIGLVSWDEKAEDVAAAKSKEAV